MTHITNIISPACRKRLNMQGYQRYSDSELNEYKYGLRFAYLLCTTLVVIGHVLNSIALLAGISVVAFAAMFPPYHPFDYLYNYAIRYIIQKPKIPPRTNQGRFACGIAFVWLAFTIYLLNSNFLLAGYIAGGMLVLVGAMVSIMDICIPSMIYNFLFRNRKQ